MGRAPNGLGSNRAVPWGQGEGRRMRPTIVALTAAALIASVAAEEVADYASESLFFEDIPTVITVSRVAERITDAPAAVSVITADDLRQFGVTRLADAFRLVPGVDVFSQDAHTSAVTARGLNSRYARRMQVLVDGRSVYQPLWGGVFWEDLLVDIEDIERIEVIRGPNAALYGANSFNGVINIITKRPEDVAGTTLSYRGGNDDYARGFGRYGGRWEALSYRVSGSYRDDEGYGELDGAAFRDATADERKVVARLGYDAADGGTLDVWAGTGGGRQEDRYTIDPTFESQINRRNDLLQARYTMQMGMEGELWFQYGYRQWWAETNWMDRPEVLVWQDVELQHAFRPFEAHRLVWGASYRSTTADSDLLGLETPAMPTDREENDELKRIFANDSFYVTDRLTLVGGAMYEENTVTGGEVSPRASVLFSPVLGHTLRATWSRAYRTPTPVEYGANSGIRGLFYLYGNDKLDSERLDSWELGARGHFVGGFDYDVELYYHKVRDVVPWIILTQIPYDTSFTNMGEALTARGAEVELGYTPRHDLRAFAHYTFHRVSGMTPTLGENANPETKAGAGCRWAGDSGLSASVAAYYSKGYEGWNSEDWLFRREMKTDSYVRLDARVAQSFCDDRAELALIGHNLLEPTHMEYPLTRADREVYAELSLRF